MPSLVSSAPPIPREYYAKDFLERVSEEYEDGGKEAVQLLLGELEYSRDSLDQLIAAALHHRPVDFERIKVVNGVHEGLLAETTGSLLRGESTPPTTKAKLLEQEHRMAGRMSDSGKDALVAIAEVQLALVTLLRGNEPLPEAVEVKELPG